MIGVEKGRYKTSRTIEFTSVENFENTVYSNSLNTNSRAFSADLQVIAPRLGAYITPYAGLGVKRYSYDDATESGTALTALTWKIEDTTIVKPYVGARFDSRETDKGLFFSADARITKFNVNQGRAPEGWTAINSRYGDVLVSVDSQVGYKFNPKAQAFAGYQHQHADQYNNNIIHLGVKIDF
jgi:hypothetical protein